MSTLTGVWRLVRCIVRRDRVRLGVWFATMVGLFAVSADSLTTMYPTQEKIVAYTTLFGDNPALIVFAGPGYGFHHPNLGTILVNETQLWWMVLAAIMSVFLVGRHTRLEEDVERAELVLANVVGRHAPTAASMIVVALLNVLIGAGTFATTLLTGYPLVGSLALAASCTAVGIVFIGLTAVAAQLTNTNRGTLGVGSGLVLVAFIVRAIGDVSTPWLRWCSPIGWAQAIRAYADERWWTLGVSAAVTIALLVLAFALASRRDLGSGLIAPRHGRPSARRWLTHPIGFAFRAQRGSLVIWLVSMLITGYVYGTIARDVDAMVASNPELAQIFAQLRGASITDSYFATTMMMLGLISSGFAISSALGPNAEEHAGRTESILAGALGRTRWLLSWLTISVVGTTLTIAIAGFGVGIAYSRATGDASEMVRLTGAALVTVPAALVLAGAAIALYGLLPHAALAAWSALVVVAVFGFFGELFRIPHWLRQASPFEHVPAVPAEPLSLWPMLVLLAIGAALIAVGCWGLERRDIARH